MRMPSIEKRCPNGYHKDPESGRCRDPITGAYYENDMHIEELKHPKGQGQTDSNDSKKKPKWAEKPLKDDDGTEYYCQNSRVFNTVTHAWESDEDSEGYDQACKNRRALLKKIKDDGRIPKVKVKPIYVKVKDGKAVETTADDPDAKILDGHIQTAELYGVEEIVNESGDKEMVFSKERQKVHQEIIMKFFKDKNFKKAEGREPIVLMTGGGSGTGKSSMEDKLEGILGVKPKTITIDPDEIMTDYLPEYEMCMKQNPLTSAFLCHEEASYLAYQIKKMCLANGYDFVWDGTMKSAEKAKKNAKEFKDAGCRVVCRGIFMPPEQSWSSCEFRFIKRGRYVPQGVAIKSNCSFTENMHDEELLDMFDDVEIYYRSDYQDDGKTVYSKADGKVTVQDKEHYDDLYYDISDYNIVKSKKFKDYTLEERKDIWNQMRTALDEAGHDIMESDIVDNLPEDEKEYMRVEQFNGIAFDSKDFLDVITVHILNGNGLDAGEEIDFDAILGRNEHNQDLEPALEELPTEKNITGEDGLMNKTLRTENMEGMEDAQKSDTTMKSVGDVFQDENGDYLYVSTGGWNWRVRVHDGDFILVFMNGGFISGEEVEMERCATLDEAYSLADTYGALFEATQKSEDAQKPAVKSTKRKSKTENDKVRDMSKCNSKDKVKKEIHDEGFWDAMQDEGDAEFINEVLDNGTVLEEEQKFDEDVGKYKMKTIRYDGKVYSVTDFERFPPSMELSKVKEQEYIKNPNVALQKCLDYQFDNKLNGLTADEVYNLTGNDAEELLRSMVIKGRVQKVHALDGSLYRFRM